MKIAQFTVPDIPVTGSPVLDPNTANTTDVVTELIIYFFALAGTLLLLYLIWGGLSLMLSRGDPKAIESGKNKVTSALIGFLIIFLAYWIVQFLGLVLGIGKITDIFI